MSSESLNFLSAVAISLAGVAMLYGSWRVSPGWKRLMRPAGWLLVGLSAFAWVRFGGAEFGIAYALATVTFAAWLFVAGAGRETRRRRGGRYQPRVALGTPQWHVVRQTLARAFVAVPLAGTASLLASVVLTARLPWTAVNRYVFAIAAAPIIWGVLATWAGMTIRLPHVALLFAGVSVACSALLFVL